MAQCAYCKAETELYENGMPLCVLCAEAKPIHPQPSSTELQVRLKLLQEVRQATDRVNAVSQSFSTIIKDIPSDVPHPDGALRITQASRELSTAREEMMKANRRLNDFLSRGVIPEDLKVADPPTRREA
jgi:hypothetical protein